MKGDPSSFEGGIPDVDDSIVNSVGLIGDGNRVFDPGPDKLEEDVTEFPTKNTHTSNTNVDDTEIGYSPGSHDVRGVIAAYFSKGRSFIEVRPPRSEFERARTEKIKEPSSGRDVDYSHSGVADGVEIILIKKKYLGDPEFTTVKERRARFLASVEVFANILGYRDFDGELHGSKKDHTNHKHKKSKK